MKSIQTKEQIIRHTIDLINETDGDIEEITIRRIAERAGIGVGLINHYFISKDKLIEQCVQEIISGVVYSFKPDLCESKVPADILKCVAKQVMDFLMCNREISRVSILSDLKRPQCDDNTMGTVKGFAYSIGNGNRKDEIQMDAFLITGALQSAFLRKDTLKETIGVDLYNKEQRDHFIELIVNKILR